MLFEAQMPWFLWLELVNIVNYLTNYFPTHANYDVSPYQHLFGKPPKLHHLQMYGYVVFIHIPKDKCVKLSVHNKKMQFFGILQ